MGLAVIIVRTVTGGVLGVAVVATRVMDRDLAALRRRLADECREGQDADRQQTLFKNPEKLDLDKDLLDYSGFERLRPQAAPRRGSWREAMTGWLEQGEIFCPPGRFVLLCLGLAALAAAG